MLRDCKNKLVKAATMRSIKSFKSSVLTVSILWSSLLSYCQSNHNPPFPFPSRPTTPASPTISLITAITPILLSPPHNSSPLAPYFLHPFHSPIPTLPFKTESPPSYFFLLTSLHHFSIYRFPPPLRLHYSTTHLTGEALWLLWYPHFPSPLLTLPASTSLLHVPFCYTTTSPPLPYFPLLLFPYFSTLTSYETLKIDIKRRSIFFLFLINYIDHLIILKVSLKNTEINNNIRMNNVIFKRDIK